MASAASTATLTPTCWRRTPWMAPIGSCPTCSHLAHKCTFSTPRARFGARMAPGAPCSRRGTGTAPASTRGVTRQASATGWSPPNLASFCAAGSHVSGVKGARVGVRVRINLLHPLRCACVKLAYPPKSYEYTLNTPHDNYYFHLGGRRPDISPFFLSKSWMFYTPSVADLTKRYACMFE